MSRAISIEALRGMVGREIGVSEWLGIDQQRVDAFADVTEDHQYIHVDPERARETPFGGTVAHGLLTLSLIVRLCLEFVPELENRQLMLNYGFDKVRFPAPVRVGSRVRARVTLADAAERGPGQVLIRLHVTFEIEGERKPALVAEWLSLHVVAGAS